MFQNKLEIPKESIEVSGLLTICPSPRSYFCPKWEVSVNADLGEG